MTTTAYTKTPSNVKPTNVKAHPIVSVTLWWYHGGATIRRAGKDDKGLTEWQARRVKRLVEDKTLFRWEPTWDEGNLYLPLTPAQTKRRIAADKRNARRRELSAMGAYRHGGWASHWQRR